MDFELKDLLDAIGPSASLIFAAWIFLTFLQARYTSAYDRYRGLIEKYRAGVDDKTEKHNVADQVLLYRSRVEQMRRATNVGVVAAIPDRRPDLSRPARRIGRAANLQVRQRLLSDSRLVPRGRSSDLRCARKQFHQAGDGRRT
jgi:hypothetical protein